MNSYKSGCTAEKRIINYWWIRIFDYRKSEELARFTEQKTWERFKGTLLDEYYLSGEGMSRAVAKQQVIEKSGVSRFAKPKNGDGVYAIVMKSDKFFYDRYNIKVDTLCFYCHKPIHGRMKDFPHITFNGERFYFCSYDCRSKHHAMVNPYQEGEFQEREGVETNGGVYGYVYHIYNRKTDMHYIGQTVFMPFFRWQEHVKGGSKGNLCDLIFETVTEVRVNSQEYLNNIEAWWIRKFIDDYGREKVMNVTVPKITMECLVEEYNQLVEGQKKLYTQT